MKRFDLTSLDVDGDGVSIAEFVNMEKPDSVAYSSVSYLTGGGGGTQTFTCPVDGLISPVLYCPFCFLAWIYLVMNVRFVKAAENYSAFASMLFLMILTYRARLQTLQILIQPPRRLWLPILI